MARDEEEPALPPSMLQRVRALRRDATDAERVLWRLLRDRHLVGRKSRRQHPLAGYVLDFCCFGIPASRPEALARFYSDLFGWKVAKAPILGEYWLCDTGTEGPGINRAAASAAPAAVDELCRCGEHRRGD